MRKILLMVALAFAVVLMAPGAAHAYETAPETATVSDGTVSPGESFTFTATGFAPGSTVTISTSRDGVTINGVSASSVTLTADANGTVSARITVNGGAGRVTITASGTDVDGGRLSVSTTVTVLSQAAGAVRNGGGGGGGLPRTGTDGTGTAIWSGVALLAAGAAMVAFSSVKRRTPEPV